MAQLSGTSNSSGANVTISTVGTTDWIHWNNISGTSGSPQRKSGGGSLISNYTAIGTATASFYNNDPSTISWVGGTPNATGSDVNGVYSGNKGGTLTGQGFSFTIPADTNVGTLNFYFGVFDGKGTLSATLSDSSAGPFSITSADSGVNTFADFNVNLTFQAASAGQTLTVTWTVSQNDGTGFEGNVTIRGIALSVAANTAVTSFKFPRFDVAFISPGSKPPMVRQWVGSPSREATNSISMQVALSITTTSLIGALASLQATSTSRLANNLSLEATTTNRTAQIANLQATNTARIDMLASLQKISTSSIAQLLSLEKTDISRLSMLSTLEAVSTSRIALNSLLSITTSRMLPVAIGT